MATRSGTTAAPRCRVNVGTKDRIGVRIALSGQTSTTCGDPLVNCYDAGSSNGLDFIRGWKNGTLTQNVPQARSVSLTSSTCVDPYFSTAATCNVAVTADVDFGTGNNDPRPDTPAGVRAALRAVVNGNTYDMTWSGGHWTSGESIPVAANAGPINVALEWAEQRSTGQVNGKDCRTQGQPFQNQNHCKGVARQRPAHVRRRRRAVGADQGAADPAGRRRRREQPASVRQHEHHVHVPARREAEPPRVARGRPERERPARDAAHRRRTTSRARSTATRTSPNLQGRDRAGLRSRSTRRTPARPARTSQSTLWASAQPWHCVAVTQRHRDEPDRRRVSTSASWAARQADDAARTPTCTRRNFGNLGSRRPADRPAAARALRQLQRNAATARSRSPASRPSTSPAGRARATASTTPCQGRRRRRPPVARATSSATSSSTCRRRGHRRP